jgi:hypothetical protein
VVPDVRQQTLQRRALGRTAGIAAIVIAGADQGPAVMDCGCRPPPPRAGRRGS